MQGRVYIHTGKGLRLANVSFDNGSPAEHLRRLNCPATSKQKRRSDHSPSKQTVSPAKILFSMIPKTKPLSVARKDCGNRQSPPEKESPTKRQNETGKARHQNAE